MLNSDAMRLIKEYVYFDSNLNKVIPYREYQEKWKKKIKPKLNWMEKCPKELLNFFV